MRVCLKCNRLAKKDALFCTECAGSFGGRRCPAGHLSPSDACHCGQCGSDQLSDAAPSLNLGFVPVLLTGLTVAGSIALAGAAWHAWAPAAGQAAARAVSTMVPPVGVWRPVAERAFGMILVWTFLLYAIPGRVGRDIRSGVGRLIRSAGRAAATLIRWTAEALVLRALLRRPASLPRGRGKR